MKSIGVEVVSGNFAFLINSYWAMEYIDGADQNEPVAHNRLEMANKGFYRFQVMLG